MRQASSYVAGVELGGTKCICTLGRGPGDIADQVVIPTADSESTLGRIVECLERWRQERGFKAVGIGSFGPLDLDPSSSSFGIILRTPKPGWNGVDLLRSIGASLDVPCRLDTDVNVAAMAEHRWGVGRGLDRFAYVTVGTGIGVGFPPAPGFPSHYHSELGHIRVARLPRDWRRSVCPYHDDCLEGLASGPSLAREAGCDAAGSHDPDDALVHVADYLAQLCQTLVCGWAVQRIAFGGGVVLGNPGLVETVESLLIRSLNGYVEWSGGPMLVEAGLSSQAGPLGTLALAQDALVHGVA